MSSVYFSLGSNVGDRLLYLKLAVHEIRTHLTALSHSSVYETIPQDVVDQPLFLNLIVCGYTTLRPQSLIQLTQKIERTIGRIPTFLKGPRVIDIDMISYGECVLKTPNLTLPHPLYHERLFVLTPLYEMNPTWICPKTGHTIRDLMGMHTHTSTGRLNPIIQKIEVNW